MVMTKEEAVIIIKKIKDAQQIFDGEMNSVRILINKAVEDTEADKR